MAAVPKTHPKPRQNRPPAAPLAELPSRTAEARIQLGARIPEANYRQLKLAAVLRGVTVQILIEQALEEFLTNHPDLLRTGPPAPPPARQIDDADSALTRTIARRQPR